MLIYVYLYLNEKIFTLYTFFYTSGPNLTHKLTTNQQQTNTQTNLYKKSKLLVFYKKLIYRKKI